MKTRVGNTFQSHLHNDISELSRTSLAILARRHADIRRRSVLQVSFFGIIRSPLAISPLCTKELTRSRWSSQSEKKPIERASILRSERGTSADAAATLHPVLGCRTSLLGCGAVRHRSLRGRPRRVGICASASLSPLRVARVAATSYAHAGTCARITEKHLVTRSDAID